MPFDTHKPVACEPVGPLCAKSAPVGEPTRTCVVTTVFRAFQLIVVMPTPEPLHTTIGLGVAVSTPLLQPEVATLAVAIASTALFAALTR